MYKLKLVQRVVLLLGLIFPLLAAGQQGAWKPERNVEIIVGTAPGAAPDKTARLIPRMWQSQRI